MPRDLSAVEPMAARAVALCEGCPMAAKFCAIRAVAPCETTTARDTHIETGGGGYSDSTIDKPARTSYRNELFDPSKNLVMADLQKLSKPKEIAKPKLVPRPRVPVMPAQKKPQVPVRPPAALVKPPPRIERSSEGGAGIIAGIIASMVGVKDSTTS